MSLTSESRIKVPRPAVVLLDIEGTICPISFVRDVLFPYALQSLPSVAESQWQDPTFQSYVSAFPEPTARQSPSALTACVDKLTRDDVKVSYLKDLQGYLWRSGYENGAFSSPLFPDVVPALRSWHDELDITLAIYSSGSVPAQKLLMQYVVTPEKGTEDLRSLFGSNYFDTVNAGPKLKSQSYQRIAEALAVALSDVLFFSDNLKETEAARGAGMRTVVVRREGNAEVSREDEKVWRDSMIWSFDEVEFKQVAR